MDEVVGGESVGHGNRIANRFRRRPPVADDGQTGDGELGMTPSMVPGNNDATFKSAC